MISPFLTVLWIWLITIVQLSDAATASARSTATTGTTTVTATSGTTILTSTNSASTSVGTDYGAATITSIYTSGRETYATTFTKTTRVNGSGSLSTKAKIIVGCVVGLGVPLIALTMVGTILYFRNRKMEHLPPPGHAYHEECEDDDTDSTQDGTENNIGGYRAANF